MVITRDITGNQSNHVGWRIWQRLIQANFTSLKGNVFFSLLWDLWPPVDLNAGSGTSLNSSVQGYQAHCHSQLPSLRIIPGHCCWSLPQLVVCCSWLRSVNKTLNTRRDGFNYLFFSPQRQAEQAHRFLTTAGSHKVLMQMLYRTEASLLRAPTCSVWQGMLHEGSILHNPAQIPVANGEHLSLLLLELQHPLFKKLHSPVTGRALLVMCTCLFKILGSKITALRLSVSTWTFCSGLKLIKHRETLQCCHEYQQLKITIFTGLPKAALWQHSEQFKDLFFKNVFLYSYLLIPYLH